jgi:hypothetical protein
MYSVNRGVACRYNKGNPMRVLGVEFAGSQMNYVLLDQAEEGFVVV